MRPAFSFPLLGAILSLTVPLAVATLAASETLPIHEDWWGDLPTWIQAIGLPIAIFATFWAARVSVGATREQQHRRQIVLTRLALAYADEVGSVFSEAFDALGAGPGTRLGQERFAKLAELLSKFPTDQLDDADTALSVYGLANLVAFFEPRYDDLVADRTGPRAETLMGKLLALTDTVRAAQAKFERKIARLDPSAPARLPPD